MIKKNAIRNTMKDKRNRLSEPLIMTCSLEITKIAYDYIVVNSFKNAAIYMSIKNEVRIEYMVALNKGRAINIFLPVCKNYNDIYFNKIDDINCMQKDYFGISCPKNDCATAVKEIEVFFIPGLAFDMSGNRVGYGKGCYDGILTKAEESLFIGVCYEFQLIFNDVLEQNSHDIKMDYILTEKGMYKVNNLPRFR
ncbi:MAG TPA: 5-formyltetrahydrofolate cyclo-ligase [bacterium]|nr:5-formyltetrahydrofolate cyclo-ligase [bacterium]